MYVITNRYRVTSTRNGATLVRDIRVPCRKDVFYEYEASHKGEKIINIEMIEDRLYTIIFSNGAICTSSGENLEEVVRNHTENMSDYDQVFGIYPVKIYDFRNRDIFWVDPDYAGRPDLIERAENGDDIRRAGLIIQNL